MNTKNLISANEFCLHQNIAVAFIISLHENGLIKITTIEGQTYFHKNQLPKLEKMIRFYIDLDINLEGIETVIYLLQQIDRMQREITSLKNQLAIYDAVFRNN